MFFTCMEIAIKAAYFVFDLIMPLVAGYLCQRQTRFGEADFDRMMTMNIMVLYPLLSLLSLWEMHPNAELVWLPVLGVAMSLLAGLAAYPLARAKYKSELDQGSFIISAMLSNTVTLGTLPVFILYGETGYAYVQLIIMFNSVVVFMLCYPLARYFYQLGFGRESEKLSVAALFFSRSQLPLLGVVLGIALYYSGLSRPAWVGTAFGPLVHIAAWTALIPVGYSIDAGELRRYWRDALDLSVIKFVVTPLAVYFVARALVSDPIALNTLVLSASTPTAINAVIAVKLHELNLHITMAAFILTTVVYLFVALPLLILILI